MSTWLPKTCSSLGAAPARMMDCDLARYAGELAHLQTCIEEALQVAEHISYKAGKVKDKQLLAISIVHMTGDEFEAAIQIDVKLLYRWRISSITALYLAAGRFGR